MDKQTGGSLQAGSTPHTVRSLGVGLKINTIRWIISYHLLIPSM